MMTGHAYYRAVRAHILAHTALMKIVMKMITLSPDSESNLAKVLYDFDTSVILDCDPEQCREISQKEQLKTRGPTAKLWVQYIEMVNLVKLFILAETSGHWELHLEIVWRMLPYFHASGHFHYSKCAHLNCISRI
ncbi:hypothetical protein JTB14_034699 [Gonioctena quinquepunctata]|nr:hypothetical protein JTB14_034699 [Gonioctena quinquepunctata]